MAVKTDEIWSADGLIKIPVKELNTGGMAWDVNKVYTQGVLVTFNYELFISKSNSVGISPITGTDNAEWKFKL